jgi:DNA-binding NarL/FixJ family response regulator
MFLAGLRRLLEDEFDVVGAVGDGQSLLEASVKLKPDVILAAISMPGLNGIEAARRLPETAPGAKMIFLTMHAEATYVKAAQDVGAAGYVLKQCRPCELFEAIHQAMNGRRYLTPLITRQRYRSSEQPPCVPWNLTTRQREVLQLVAEGNSRKEIAGLMHVSIKTVEFHKHSIMRELGLHSTMELMRFAIRHGLVAA